MTRFLSRQDIFISQTDETEFSTTNAVWVELFSNVDTFICVNAPLVIQRVKTAKNWNRRRIWIFF